MKFLLAKKIGMTTIFDDTNKAENVTLLEVGENVVVGKRTPEKDGYTAIQVAFKVEEDKNKKKKSNLKIREYRVANPEEIAQINIGDKIDLSQVEKGEKVMVQGISKGKGYQGVMKRHGFKGSPASHGHRHDHRAPGSIGSAFPERVMKGKKMAGRMGGEKVTTKNLKVVLIDNENNLLALKGPVPGNRGSLVVVFK